MYCFEYEMLVNKEHRLSPSYIPDNLTEPSIPFIAPEGDPKRLLEYRAAKAAEDLFAGALGAGLDLYGISGYRSYERQREIYDNAADTSYIAPPGGSEHQTGLALDVSCPDVDLDLIEEFADTAEGIWLKRHAPLYGFILRYPKSKEKITGYACEPWHIRYVTRSLALYLTLTGLTLEEYHVQAPTVPSGAP